MNCAYLFILPIAVTAISCSKNSEGKKDIYVVSAGNIIGLTGSNWNSSKGQLNNKTGFLYSNVSGSQSNYIKAAVSLPAIDDSNRNVNGIVVLNITTNDIVNYAAFNVDSLSQAAAFAMVLSYNKESSQILSGISSSTGQVSQNGMAGNPSVDVIITKINNGESVDQLSITYQAEQGKFTTVIFRQPNGSYGFSYRGSR